VFIGLSQIAQACFRRAGSCRGEDGLILRIRIGSLGIIVQILKEPLAADQDASGNIELGESVLLGIALGLDAFGVGLGMSMTGLSPWMVPIVAFSSSAFVFSGVILGFRVRQWRAQGRWQSLPATILVLLGLLRLIR